jgi:outer membrane receptor protein involved in Fe transport
MKATIIGPLVFSLILSSALRGFGQTNAPTDSGEQQPVPLPEQIGTPPKDEDLKVEKVSQNQTTNQTKGKKFEASKIDSKSVEVVPNATQPKTAIFAPGEVTVRAEKVATIDRAATQTIVTATDIEAHNDRNLGDTLQLVPGMSIYQHGKGHIRFRMRGFEMPYVALLVDGIPISDVYEANVDISKLPVMNASAIVVNRGTSSALYGTNGTIGSINIITTKPLELYAKTQGEVGLNGDYLLNVAHGNASGRYYYWVTGTVEKQAPFDVSERLNPRWWFNRAMPRGLGYTVDSSNAAATEYLNAGTWPHQEAHKLNLSAKVGYQYSKAFETGISANYNQSSARRYSISVQNTEEYTQGGWPTNDPMLRLTAGAFDWRDVYTVTVAPYAQYRASRFSVKGNVYFQYATERLDGYQDPEHAIPVAGWGGAHSNWRNRSEGFNVFPSYELAEWNRLNGSVLFRWDKHTERIQADDAFVGQGPAGGGADAAYALAGDDWALTKLMTQAQATVAIEDELSLTKLAQIPVELSVGVSYDAQKLGGYRARSQTMMQGRVIEYGHALEDQYIAKSDSTVWGTRDSFNPVFGVTYRAIEDLLWFRASLSRKTKLPTLAQYANVYENTDVGLKPETSVNGNIGVQIYFQKRLASLRADYFFSRFRDKLATIYDPDTPSIRYYTNVSGQNHEGIELVLNRKSKNFLRVGDLDASVSYMYLSVHYIDPGEDNSLIAKGGRVPDVPKHQLTADVQFQFVTGTALSLFGGYLANTIRYTMRDNPEAGAPLSTSNYKTFRMHDSAMLNAKVSQKILDRFGVYFMARNILDDYAVDPFNPGPGRQFYLGATATY